MKTTHKLAMTVFALSLTQAVNASDQNIKQNVENNNTYWGVGIGSVLGAVIAGPPGAAIGASLGGSIGWGKDQHDALDESLSKLEQGKIALQQKNQALYQKHKSLSASTQKLNELERRHTQQTSRLNALQELKGGASQASTNTAFLENLVQHYAQDIYFRSGQSDAPEYAKDRLANLVELLKSHPELHVTLKGYTDPFGSAKLNAKLAQARVNSIKDALHAQGIDASRVSGIAIGEVVPEAEAANASTETSSSDELMATASASKYPSKAKDHVLDRRVSIELSILEQTAHQVISKLASIEPLSIDTKNIDTKNIDAISLDKARAEP